jgi:mono/diheme cytochrome c family protein
MKQIVYTVKGFITRTTTLLGGLALVVSMTLSSCGDPNSPGYEFMPNMYRSPSPETYGVNEFYKDSMSARTPVAGTVARGYKPWGYGSSNEEYLRAGAEVSMPFAYSDKIDKEGKELYGIFCMQCHGKDGNGDGSVVEKGGFPPPPSYSSGSSSRGGKMSDLKPGQIYHTLMYGLNNMGSHASQIRPEDRWKIVYYVTKLQGNDPTTLSGAGGSAAAHGTGVGEDADNAPTDHGKEGDGTDAHGAEGDHTDDSEEGKKKKTLIQKAKDFVTGSKDGDSH